MAAGVLSNNSRLSAVLQLKYDATVIRSESVEDFRDPAGAIINTVSTSIVWTADLAYAEAQRRIGTVLELEYGWNSYGAEPPNAVAGALARQAIDMIRRNYFAAPHILPSSEGGIAAAFVANNRFGQVEILNSGTVLTTTFSDNSAPHVAEFASDEVSLSNALETVRNFLFR